MKKGVKFSLLIVILIAGLLADWSSKQFAMSRIKNSSPITIIDGLLEFSYVENRGMVFGVLNDPDSAGLRRFTLAALKVVSMIVILFIIWRIRDLPFFYLLPFFMILTGAIGNLIDRVRYGFVVDFIHMHWRDKLDYPWLYNIADALVVVGIFILLILLFTKNEALENALDPFGKAGASSSSDSQSSHEKSAIPPEEEL
ncbi:signal peptidase II [candidate division KSB1 bacterium]|nr:signal peptidase II [candidate division KSB1 bacterium]